MKSLARSTVTSMGRRRQLLEGIPGFQGMPAALLDELAASLQEEHFPLGSVIVAEGEYGNRLFLIESGEAEVSTPGATAAVSLAHLGPGDMFGEIALLSPHRRRQATVTATTPIVTYTLQAAAFDKALETFPEARFDIAALADTMLTAKFLKQQGSWRNEGWTRD